MDKRRTIAPRCARFAQYGKTWSALDRYLESRAGASGATVGGGDIQREMAKFFLESGKGGSVRNAGEPVGKCTSSGFEAYSRSLRLTQERSTRTSNEADRAQRRARLQMQLIEEFEGGRSVTDLCPKLMTNILETLRPTSCAAERAFSKARNSRRYSQEHLKDEHFVQLLLLKEFYAKSMPWKGFEKVR